MGSTAVHREAVEDPPKPVSAARQSCSLCAASGRRLCDRELDNHVAGRANILHCAAPDSAASANGEVVPVCFFSPVFFLPFPVASRLVRFCPLVILIYKFCVFPTTAFENHFPAAFHEYFGGGFLIEEFHSYRELFQLYGNPDMRRGMQQLNFTAPVYAAIGYSIGTWLGMYYRVFPAFFKKRRGL